MSIIADSVVALNDPGTLTAAAGQAVVSFPIAVDVTGVTVSVLTAPVGSTAIWDVNKNGTTIFTTQSARPTIAAAAKVSPVAVPEVTRFAVGDLLAVDCDQIGSGTAGAEATIAISYRPAQDTPTN